MQLHSVLLFFFTLISLTVNSQLREFEVIQMAQADVPVVQANTQFPDDALVLVYSIIEGLEFRSSLGGIDKATYNATASRYELLLKPMKQMLFAAKSGFIETKVTTLNPNPKDVFYFKVEEKLNEDLRGRGTVSIRSEPIDAQIYINGLQLVNKTPFSQEMPAGVNSITLKKGRYLDLDTLIRIKPNSENDYFLKMRPAWADLSIKTNATEALISINGQQKGFGMVNYQGIDFGMDPGNYLINISLDKYRPYSQNISLIAGQIENLNISLEPMAGNIGVASEPKDADVFLNGRKVGRTPYISQMPIGEYSLEINKEGYKKEVFNFNLKDKETREFKPTLLNYSQSINPIKRKVKKYRNLAIIGAIGAAGFYYGGIYAYREYPKATNQAANLRRFVVLSDIIAPTLVLSTTVSIFPMLKNMLKVRKLKKEFGSL